MNIFERIGYRTGCWIGMHLPEFVVRWYGRRIETQDFEFPRKENP